MTANARSDAEPNSHSRKRDKLGPSVLNRCRFTWFNSLASKRSVDLSESCQIVVDVLPQTDRKCPQAGSGFFRGGSASRCKSHPSNPSAQAFQARIIKRLAVLCVAKPVVSVR